MSEILVEHVRPGVVVIRLDAPSRRNALRGDMARDFVAACLALKASPDVGAAVITGGPVAFCAGADRALLSAVASGDPDAEAELLAIVLGSCAADRAEAWAVELATRAGENPALARWITESVDAVAGLPKADAAQLEADAQRRSLACERLVHDGS